MVLYAMYVKPELAEVAIRVLSQVFFSILMQAHGHIQAKVRNKFAPDTTDN